MAFTANVVWEIEPSSGSDTQGGGFDPSQIAGMLTDGAATSATGTSPVFTSASYNFVSGDVGAWVFIASGTNWIPGWYSITSVATNAATLSAAPGAAILYNDSMVASTSTGCATTASPTGATWSIDYSQQASAQISYTDIIIGATTTQGTSALHPFGKQMVGNFINIASGTGFSVQTVCLQSVSTVTATFDKSLGSAASTGGHGKLGGALATLSSAISLGIACNWFFCKSTGTYTTTSIQDITFTSSPTPTYFIGYTTTRADNGQFTWTTSTNSINLVELDRVINIVFKNFKWTTTAGTPGYGIYPGTTNNSQDVAFVNCYWSGFTYAMYLNYTVDAAIMSLLLDSCEITGCTTGGIYNSGSTRILGCYIHGNTGNGVECDGTGGVSNASLLVAFSVIKSNTSSGITILNTNTIVGQLDTVVISSAIINNPIGILIGARASSTLTPPVLVWNCIIDTSSTVGIQFASAPQWAWGPSFRNNAYWNNAADITGGPAKDASDVVLTGDPFTSRSTGDFTLNSTSGAGALCRGAGYPTIIPG